MNKKIIFQGIWLCLALLMSVEIWGQQIILDKPVRAGELILFPDLTDQNTYYYVPDKPRIATNPTTGKPMFSFLRYVQNVRGTDSKKDEGEGGGIVHAVVTLEVTPEQRSRAEQELRRVNSSGRIAGPIIYSGGTIALISSFAKPDGTLTQQVVGLGKAPILEGQKAAISVQLTKLGAKILWESFQTPTPDMSVSFEMEMKGFRSPKRAIIEANFDQIYEHKSFELGAAANAGPVLLAAEIKTAYEDLIKTGAIKVTQIGTDENMEKAIEDAYGKLTRMMFEPAGGTGTPNLGQLASVTGGQTSMLDRATNMLNQARQETRQDNQRNLQFALENDIGPHDIRYRPSRDTTATAGTEFTPPRSVSHDEATRIERENDRRRGVREAQANQIPLPSLAVAASFQMKRIRQQGIFRIDLNKYTADNLALRFDGNFGNIQCKECFHSVNLDDPLYRQRELTAFLDGMNTEDFGKYINFVDVQIRKTHQNGETTTEELRVDRTNFNQQGNNFNFVYGWKGDEDRAKWLNYEYRTVWNFFGGFNKPIEWTPTLNATIPLSPPYLRRLVDVEADPNTIKDAGIRAIEVIIYFPLGEKEQTRQFRLNTKAGQFSNQIDIFQQPNQLEYDYEVKWYLNDGSVKQSGKRKSNSSVLFVDNF